MRGSPETARFRIPPPDFLAGEIRKPRKLQSASVILNATANATDFANYSVPDHRRPSNPLLIPLTREFERPDPFRTRSDSCWRISRRITFAGDCCPCHHLMASRSYLAHWRVGRGRRRPFRRNLRVLSSVVHSLLLSPLRSSWSRHANSLRYSAYQNRLPAKYRSRRTPTKHLLGPPECGGVFGAWAEAESRRWLQSQRR